MQILTGRHLDNLLELREQLSMNDIDLVSSSIAHNKTIDHAIKAQIVSLHPKLAALILGTVGV